MKIELENVLPVDIEKRSFELITEELGERTFPSEQESIIKRVIHTTADFDYADSLCFSEQAVEKAKDAIRRGACIVTDTKMAQSGINKKVLEQFGGEVYNFMADKDVAAAAKENGTTRAVACIDKAAALGKPLIFVIGNAPTALVRLYELIKEEKIHPELIIGVPVGFVNVVPSKELIMETDVPYIVAKGRKGGSNVAAAICNALLYQMDQTRGAKSGTKENQPDQEKISKRPEQSHEFFENKKCQYYPCHEGMEVMNCMFCYCPMYRLEHCPGRPEYFEKDGKRIKVCTNCTFPHQPENYSIVLEVLKKEMF